VVWTGTSENAAEINAITEFLWRTPNQATPRRTHGRRPAKGKQIVETVGCFGCHAVGAIKEVANQSQIRRRHGYNLENQGSKVSQAWLYNWVKDPAQVARYQDAHLRLSDDEAADVSAYLSSMKNPEWEKKPLPQIDAAALDDVALELLRNNSTDIEAREKTKRHVSRPEELYVGERLISRYGCFGCHTIPNLKMRSRSERN
jgi:mono/diheme cytochrome c family protein